MTKVKDVFGVINGFAPVSSKLDFDNVGLLVGDAEQEVSRVLLTLDITDDVISEAAEKKCGLIVSHHPLFFELKHVTRDDLIGRKVLALASNGISAVCMHTNLDAAYVGVNDALAAALGLHNVRSLETHDAREDDSLYGIGRFGELEREEDIKQFLENVKTALKASGLRYTAPLKTVKKVAVVGGSGGAYLEDALKAGCDTLVTADVKYNVFLDSEEYGINVIDAGHFPTENVVLPCLKARLESELHGCTFEISDRHCQPESFYC